MFSFALIDYYPDIGSLAGRRDFSSAGIDARGFSFATARMSLGSSSVFSPGVLSLRSPPGPPVQAFSCPSVSAASEPATSGP